MLFIGGSQDGKRIDVPDNRGVWEIGNLSKVPAQFYCKGARIPITAPAGEVERYMKVNFERCEMMLIDYLSIGDIMPRLLGNYMPEGQPWKQ